MAILLATAATAAAGTLYTPEQARKFLLSSVGERGLAVGRALGVLDVFHGLLFAVMLGMIAVCVALCTWHRLPVIAALATGYPGGRRRRWTVLTDAAMHLSILAVLAAAAAEALFGVVGTKNIPVGISEAKVFEWQSEREVPLGFAIEIEELGMTHFPALAKIGITEFATGKRLELLTVREGGKAQASDGSLALREMQYDITSATLEMVALQGGNAERVRFSTKPDAQSKVLVGEYGLTLVAWRRDLREVTARINIKENDRVVKQDLLRVNGSMRHRGWHLYLTGWGRDEFGNDYAGIQAARKPGAELFWIGSALFSLCLPAYFVLRRRFSGSR